MTEQNSVYLTYRRGVGGFIAEAVYQDLRGHGIDVFMDPELARGEQAESVMLNQIGARPYFVLIVTPGTLEGCMEKGDWLLMQIARAAELKRNFVVLVSPQATLDNAAQFLGNALGGIIRAAKTFRMDYNAFGGLMDKVRAQALKPIATSVTSAPAADAELLADFAKALDGKTVIKPAQVAAQAAFERAFTRKRDDWDGRIADYSEAIKLCPTMADAYARRGANRDVRGDLDGALDDITEALFLKPYSEVAYINRGIVRQKKQDLDGAIADFDQAIRLNPQLAAAYFNRGVARYLKADYDGALGDHSEAIRLNPNFVSYHYYRGLARMAKREYNEALVDFNNAEKLNAEMAELYYNRGLVHLNLGNTKAASDDWSTAIKLNPEFIAAYYNRGIVRAHSQDLDGTIDDMSKVLDSMPDTPEVRKVRAQIEEVKRLKSGIDSGNPLWIEDDKNDKPDTQ